MIKVDISNIWGSIAFSDLMAIEKEVSAAHAALEDMSPGSSDVRGWMHLPRRGATAEITRIQEAAAKIRAESDALVTAGVGGPVLGAQGAIELLQGPNRNIGKAKGDPMVLFTGASFSSRHYDELVRLLDGKDFSAALVSKSGSTTVQAIATRALTGLLQEKYGTEEGNARIYAITDPCKGTLRKAIDRSGWQSFHFPPTAASRFSVLSPAGLLPMAVAGIDIMEVLNGAMDAKEACNLRSYENPVWLYAAARNLFLRTGKSTELLGCFEPGFRRFGAWWQQLFSESEGKEGKGLFPVPIQLPEDLHCLGQFIQEGPRNLFETVLRFDTPEQTRTIDYTETNRSKLNYLAGKPLEFAENCSYESMVEAHTSGGVPIITIDCGTLDDRKIGELFYFMEYACCVSAYILGVNPFDNPGTVKYRYNMRQSLRQS